MFSVYLIQSEKTGTRYLDYSSNLKNVLAEHNAGKASFTKKAAPWKLVYYEAYVSETLARVREQKLKQHGKRYTELLKRVTDDTKEEC